MLTKEDRDAAYNIMLLTQPRSSSMQSAGPVACVQQQQQQPYSAKYLHTLILHRVASPVVVYHHHHHFHHHQSSNNNTAPRWQQHQLLRGRRQCQHCGRADVTLHLCSRCLLACYCSKECQRRDWHAIHQNKCAHAHTATDAKQSRLLL